MYERVENKLGGEYICRRRLDRIGYPFNVAIKCFIDVLRLRLRDVGKGVLCAYSTLYNTSGVELSNLCGYVRYLHNKDNIFNQMYKMPY